MAPEFIKLLIEKRFKDTNIYFIEFLPSQGVFVYVYVLFVLICVFVQVWDCVVSVGARRVCVCVCVPLNSLGPHKPEENKNRCSCYTLFNTHHDPATTRPTNGQDNPSSSSLELRCAFSRREATSTDYLALPFTSVIFLTCPCDRASARSFQPLWQLARLRLA